MAVFRCQWDQLQDWSECWMQRESGSLDRFLVNTAAASTEIPRLQGSGSCPVCFGTHASHKGKTRQLSGRPSHSHSTGGSGCAGSCLQPFLFPGRGQPSYLRFHHLFTHLHSPTQWIEHQGDLLSLSRELRCQGDLLCQSWGSRRQGDCSAGAGG